MKLSGKLLESAQKQSFTVGELIGSLEDAGTGETRVVAKEKDILSFTEQVDRLINSFNAQIQRRWWRWRPSSSGPMSSARR